MISHIVFDHDDTLVNTAGVYKSVFPGVKELLVQLKQMNFSLYVWTARDRKSTLEYLKNLEISHIFADISTATDCTPKPHPEGLEEMFMGVDPKTVVHVGDSYTDIIGAAKFGCTSIGALWAHNTQESRDTLEHFKADYICETPDEVLKVIKNLVKELNHKG